MSSENDPFQKIIKYAGIAAVSIGINHILKSFLNKNTTPLLLSKEQKSFKRIPSVAMADQFMGFVRDDEEIKGQWSTAQLPAIVEETDGLLQELQIMTRIVCPFERVHNLIVDLQIKNPKTYPCPLVAHKIKRSKDEPFLSPESLIEPGQFVIQNCVFRAGQSVETEKKFMKAGPRSTQYFNAGNVRADIICLGRATPGINNVIRELVILLKQVYKVDKVTGVKFSWRGYYDKEDKGLVELTPEMMERIHHKGGCYLGLATSECRTKEVVDSLQKRGVNQLYLIGGNITIKYARELHKQIQKRKLNIALCVCLKAINKDIAYFDNCFGFESAVEQAQKFIDQGYALASSNYNSVVLIKVPGRFSGFLAVDAVGAARNANICLVPEFKFNLYGEKGLLNYIANRVQNKGYCIVVYSQGASYAVNDIPSEEYHRLLLDKETSSQYSFDLFLKKQIEAVLNKRNINPHNTFFFDSQHAVRTVSANSFDTKLCSQIAIYSIQGLMCGYTNFAIGHFKTLVALVPLNEMDFSYRYCLRVEDQSWQRLLATTNQPPFIDLQ